LLSDDDAQLFMTHPTVIAIPEWPYVLGEPEARGTIRSIPEDFNVEELGRVLPQGEGSHLWLWVEKRSANTEWVARELAKLAGCALRDVGYAGLKDRHAVTRQWYSVPFGEAVPLDLEAPENADFRILKQLRHGKKLKRGTLNGNRFDLKIRDLKADGAAVQERLEYVCAHGVPNYFGPQRFGHGGRNVQQGFELLSKRARLPKNKRSIYLSAIRSYLFNQVLAERVNLKNWDKIIDGDLAMLNGTHSVFPCEKPDAEIEDRCNRHDIHPSGPMPGDGGTQPGGSAYDLEQRVLQAWPELTELLRSQRLQASRRCLRLFPSEMAWNLQEGELDLTFTLPAGAYATTVLRELLLVRDAPQPRPVTS